MNASNSGNADRGASRSIWVFTPSRTAPADLEAILVQRHELLKDAVERVRESALTDHKHHLLFVGPRGCGKTHLVTLIVSRISADEEASQHLRLAWLNEDETCTSLLELLVKVHTALEKRYADEFRAADLAEAYELKPAAALEFVAKRLLGTLGSKTLVIVTENLDALFDSMGQEGQKQLRAFIQEHPQFAIVATAQRLVEDLSDRASPFFGFFQTEHLKPLSVEQATRLLQNIARLQGKPEVTEFLATGRGRSRVRALHHLSGGNHRIYIVLSQFITRETMDALIGPFLKMVDELTPYYQERVRWLPPLQRKIVEMLCTCETTVPVKEIARRLFSTPQTVSSQLQDLREKGYVESSQRGRESLYEISEPLMRICVEVKENQNTQPLRLLVDFLRVWYDDAELERRRELSQPDTYSHNYLSAALVRNAKDGNLRMRMLAEEVLGRTPTSLNAEALKELEAALPEDLLIAIQCLKEGDAEGALECCDAALAVASNANAKALTLLVRAESHYEVGHRVAAITDCTSVIELPGVSPEQVAKALFNRGVTYRQQGDTAAGIVDYTRVIELTGAPPEVVAEALFNRGVIHGQQADTAAEIADYTRVVELTGAPPNLVAEALINRGVRHQQRGDTVAAVADCTRAIDLPGAPPEHVANALFNRGLTNGQQGDSTEEIADYTRVITLCGAPPDQIAMALLNRGVTHSRQGDTGAAISDYTQFIELPGAPAHQLAQALFNRGVTHGQQGDTAAALADYARVIESSGAPPDQVAMALVNRGVTHGEQGEAKAALADYTRVIELPGTSAEYVAQALFNRGLMHHQQGDRAAALSDYTRVIELPGSPVELVAKALVNRGFTQAQLDDTAAALADYTRVIELPGAPTEQVTLALVNRGVTHDKQGDTAAALADCTRVIELPGATIDQAAMATYNRGVIHLQGGNRRSAREDLEAVMRLPNAPVKTVVDAHLALAELHFSEGKWQSGFEAIEAGLRLGSQESPAYFDAPVDVIGVLFTAGLNLEGRVMHAESLFARYAPYSALTVLGEALVKHLGTVFTKGEPWPASDNLDQWLTAWQQAASDSAEFKLPLRLLRVGIEFIKSAGKDRGVLLTLTSPERDLLRQAFGLAET